MQKLILKTATGIAALGILVGVMAPAAFAQSVTIANNGPLSKNTVKSTTTNKNVVKQKSTTVALTFVSSNANTGKNTVKGNVGTGASIVTGPATSIVETTVTGGDNVATGSECGCPVADTDVDISGNGALSKNTVTTTSNSTNVVKQTNTTVAVTAVSSTANSGGNNVSYNVGGTSDVMTDSAVSSVGTTVTGGGNSAL